MKFRWKLDNYQIILHLIFGIVVLITLGETARSSRRSTPNGSWLRMGMMVGELMQGDEAPGCQTIPGLSTGQNRLCQLYKDHMPSVSSGARQALQECKHQFQHRRWNCSLLDNVNVFGPVINIASRESAFAHALSAAGVTHAVARSCRDGQLQSCGCSRMGRPKDLRKDWVWGGCGDNLEYGYKFTQGFVDVRERERRYKRGSKEQGRSLMNLHNNEAGRRMRWSDDLKKTGGLNWYQVAQNRDAWKSAREAYIQRAVIQKAKVTCKCHGVSGSCSLITCWQQLPTFREVSDTIREKYDGATEVRVNKRGRLQLGDPRFRLPTPNDLVYLEDSPNYCVQDPILGSLGTAGRPCNRTSLDMDGCNLLCCGRGYNTIKTTIRERCHCHFKWCCEVQCKTCVKTIDMHTCK